MRAAWSAPVCACYLIRDMGGVPIPDVSPLPESVLGNSSSHDFARVVLVRFDHRLVGFLAVGILLLKGALTNDRSRRYHRLRATGVAWLKFRYPHRLHVSECVGRIAMTLLPPFAYFLPAMSTLHRPESRMFKMCPTRPSNRCKYETSSTPLLSPPSLAEDYRRIP